MIRDIIELNFPKKDGKQYATLTHASIPQADMGEKTISTQIKIDGDIVPDFSFDWEVEFQGEKYIMPLRIPQGAKENTSLNSTIDLTFQHWAIYQLKRWPFVTIQQIAAGTYLPDEEVAPVQLNLKDFCILFGQVLEYYYGGAITIDLNPAWQYKQETTRIEISHTKIWNVLIDAFHDKYGVRWEIKPAADNSNTVKGGERYVIRVGYPTTEVGHIFEYGFDGGLLKVERQVQSEEIRNMLKGRGGETNIPFRYFKNTDPNNPDFRPDPDWVEELANIPFTNLMPATFRSYVQGWKAAHISKYPGYTAVGENNAYAPWAYRKGYTDTKFHPVEFVADEITINPAVGDRNVEILPGYSPKIKNGSSIDKYGPLPDTFDNNDIYPTLQDTGCDIAVDIEQVITDDVTESVSGDAVMRDVGGARTTARNVGQSEYVTLTIRGKAFTVDPGTKAILYDDTEILYVFESQRRGAMGTVGNGLDVSTHAKLVSCVVNVYDSISGAKRSASGIPAGTYYYEIEAKIHNLTTDKTLDITVGAESPRLIVDSAEDEKWKHTFDVWVKNIWDSTRRSGETDSQYSERVWKPVLGDREGNEGKVMFTSGALVHEDYEFTIVDFPVPDTSKTWEEKDDNGVIIATHTSHWRIKLAKSDAELETTGLYVPSTKKQGKAGDRFVFIGTEMTHVPYVVDAEKRLDDWKKDQLGEVKEIKPTAVVTTDRVRINNEGKPNALINQLRVGNSVRLFDKRFFNEEGKAYETLYLQSITYTYRESSSDDAALNPDVEIVLGNEYATSANPVSMMQGEISALQRQVGSISNVEQIVRAVGDRLYLRKDGISDRSLSPTQFFSLLTSGDFRPGLIGGTGWGFYKDENGNWVLEADRVNVRQEMQVNTLVINQAEGRGGMEIDTAAYIEGVTHVVETDSGYVCYFDQKNGTVANLFHVNDVAYCNRWTPENTELKFYKRRVTAVSEDSITLSKTDVNGTGIPAEGDNIIHFGNYTDATRQYIKVRDVVGGGYERYIEALNSVNAAGVEYYFVGKQAGESRWFVGNKDLVPYSGAGDGSYIEYINRKFNLNNVSLSVNTTIGDQTFEQWLLGHGYTDDSALDAFKQSYNSTIADIKTQIDGKAETWYQGTNPATAWTTAAAKSAHVGDLWYCTADIAGTNFKKDTTWYWDGTQWQQQNVPKSVFDAIDGKADIYVSKPTSGYKKNDLWFLESDYTLSGVAYKTGTLVVAIHDMGTTWKASDWIKKDSYTDDTTANKALTEISGYEYLKKALVGATQVSGGLLLSSLIKLGIWDKTNPASPVQTEVRAGMNGIYDSHAHGGGVSTWWGGDMIDLFKAGTTGLSVRKTDAELGVNKNKAARALVRMNGSAYFANGNVGFEYDGSAWLGNENGLRVDKLGNITMGNGVTVNVSNVDGLQATLNSLTNFNIGVTRLLAPWGTKEDGTTGELSWQIAFNPDPVHGGIRAKSLKAKVGLWSNDFISARGQDGQPGGGGGSLFGLYSDWAQTPSDTDALAAPLGKELYTKFDDYYTALTIDSLLAAKASATHSHDISEITGLQAALNGKVPTSRKVNAGTGLMGGGALSADITIDLKPATASVIGGVKKGANINIATDGTISTHAPYSHPTGGANKTIAAATGKVLSAITVNSFGHVTSVDSKSLAATDIPGLPWSKITSGKPTTLAGYGITDALGVKNIGSKVDFQNTVILLWKDSEVTTHRLTGTLYTTDYGSARHQVVDLDLWFSRWGTATSNYDVSFKFNTYGQGTYFRLVTCTYNGEKWWAIRHTNVQACTFYFEGTQKSIAWEVVKYYNTKTAEVLNSEINGSIAEVDTRASVYSGSLCPAVNDTFPLGNTSYRWSTIYGVNVNLEGSISRVISDTVTRTALTADAASNTLIFGDVTGVSMMRGKELSFQNVVGTTCVKIKDGKMGIGTTAPSDLLTVNGTAKVTTLKIGSVTLTEVNGALHIDKGVYSDDFVSARGQDGSAGSGGSGGGLFGLNDTWGAVTNQNSTNAFTDYAVWNGVEGIRAGLQSQITSNYNTLTTYGTAITALSDALNAVKGNYVTTNTAQTISGVKTFSNDIKFSDIANGTFPVLSKGIVWAGSTDGASIRYKLEASDLGVLRFDMVDDANTKIAMSWNGTTVYDFLKTALNATGVTATFAAIKKNGGTSSQFLKADGSVDSTAYLPASSYTAADVLAKIKTVDGSGSGLDADLLDGKHLVDLLSNLYARADQVSIYDLRHNFGTYNKGDYASGQYVSEYPTGYGRYISLTYSDKNGGALIFVDTPTSNGLGHIRVKTRGAGNSNTQYCSDWGIVAYTTDNVASATKLSDNTAFTAWGQTFFLNGKPKTASGNMTGVGKIGFSNDREIGFNSSRFCFGTNNQGAAVGVNVGSLLVSNAWADYTKVPANGIYSKGAALFGSTVTASGLLTASGGVTIPSGKTLKIGSITLEEVNGALHVNKGVYSDDFISARGADSASSGGGSLFGLINVWPTSDPGANTTDALGANLGYALHTRVTALEGKNYLDALNVTTTGSGNAVTAVALSADKKLITVTKGATFLTAHQAVSNKAATLAWNAATTIATVGATNITVKLPANPNTDTKNTAGSTNTSSKIFLIGATAQSANPQTYSHDTAYVGIDGCLYSGGTKVLTAHQSLANYVTLNSDQTISGKKTFSSSVVINNASLILRHPDTTGGTAKSVYFQDSDASTTFAFGSYIENHVLQHAYIGWTDLPWAEANCLAVSSSKLKYKTNDILHAGNYAGILDGRYLLKTAYTAADVLTKLKTVDGSGSGLDADLLDGVHNGYLTANRINANGTPQGGHVLTWFSGQPTLGSAAGNAKVGSNAAQNLWSFPSGGTAADSAAGGVANIMNLRLGWDSKYWVDIFTSPNYDRLWYRRVYQENNVTKAGAWKQIAFTSDNVASANKLYTARKINGTAFNGTADITTSTWGATRTLWGRSCNGSANISGDMTDVGSIKMNSAIFLTRPNSAGKGIYLQGNDAGGASFYLHLNYAAVAGGNVMTFAYDRKVGVNTVSPSYTLDVNGSAIVRSVLRIGNESSTVSPAILSLSSGALKCNLGIYSEDFISARGQDTSSDARMKSFVESISVDIAKIAAAPLWRFRWKDSGKMDAGSVAQYWQDVEPLLVHEYAGHLTLSYGKAAMLAAVTTARRLLEDERRIREHGDRIAQLEARVAELEAALSDGAKAEAAG